MRGEGRRGTATDEFEKEGEGNAVRGERRRREMIYETDRQRDRVVSR